MPNTFPPFGKMKAKSSVRDPPLSFSFENYYQRELSNNESVAVRTSSGPLLTTVKKKKIQGKETRVTDSYFPVGVLVLNVFSTAAKLWGGWDVRIVPVSTPHNK